MNEEDIKNNLVIPLLQSVGISASELSFESNFVIQLGRGVYTVRGKETKAATGRSDILCRRNGKPLFLVELKAEGEELTDADRRQGLSYARLLDPMAPYVIISNGQQTLILETLGGEAVNQIAEETALRGFFPKLDEEIALRFEALKHFVGYSYDNLLKFCHLHNERILEKFRAEPSANVDAKIRKKYIPEVYVHREVLERSFERFLEQNDKCVFAIVGDSGVGKTNVVCSLVETIASDPALFYSGSLLGSLFLKEFGTDFNLDFSPQECETSVLKKVSALAGQHDKSFVIFIDAIDEWEAADKTYQLNLITKSLEQLNVKLVVSCKSLVWRSFLSRNGIPTTLADCLYPEVPELTDFDSVESKDAVINYRKLLELDQLDETVAFGVINPFALRVACEVAYIDQVPLDLSKDSRNTLNRYLVPFSFSA